MSKAAHHSYILQFCLRGRQLLRSLLRNGRVGMYAARWPPTITRDPRQFASIAFSSFPLSLPDPLSGNTGIHQVEGGGARMRQHIPPESRHVRAGGEHHPDRTPVRKRQLAGRLSARHRFLHFYCFMFLYFVIEKKVGKASSLLFYL